MRHAPPLPGPGPRLPRRPASAAPRTPAVPVHRWVPPAAALFSRGRVGAEVPTSRGRRRSTGRPAPSLPRPPSRPRLQLRRAVPGSVSRPASRGVLPRAPRNVKEEGFDGEWGERAGRGEPSSGFDVDRDKSRASPRGNIAWEVAGRRGNGWRLYFGGACPGLSPRARTGGCSARFRGRYEGELLPLEPERVASMLAIARGAIALVAERGC
ncbi:hypothetical protein ACHAXT_005795 [Thalassiosira profunda]